ncbi:MAG TPA: PEP-CTERM sorting domain-containing protein [Planctomycetaceae bacterium]
MNRVLRRIVTTAFAMLAVLAARSSQADIVYQDVNGSLQPGPFYWASSSGTIGWYWTPATNVELTSIETQLNTFGSNVNNNANFTTTLFTDRPAVGGMALESSVWNGTQYNPDGWLGSAFATPLTLTGGTTYFIGMSGFNQVLTGSGGAGVNWINPPTQPGAQTLGAGSSYTGTDFDLQLNPDSSPGSTDDPILRFLAQTPTSPTPEPSSLVLLSGFAASICSFSWFRRRKSAWNAR